MQTIRQQKTLSSYTQDGSLPQWEHNWNGRPCRQEDFEAERLERHVQRRPVDKTVVLVCIGAAIVMWVLGVL